MPITAADLTLRHALRPNDALDGGGPMSVNVVQDALENNVFPDIGSIARAQGELKLRKVYAAVLSANRDAMLDAHVIVETLPVDPAVSVVLLANPGAGSVVSDLTTAVNDSGGEAYNTAGATPTTAAAAAGAATVKVAGVRRALLPQTRLQQAVGASLAQQPTSTAQVLALVDAGGGNTVAAYRPRRTLLVPVVTGPQVYSVQLPVGTMPGTEKIELTLAQTQGSYVQYSSRAVAWADGSAPDGTPPGSFAVQVSPNGGYAYFSFANINRATGVLSFVLSQAPTGSPIKVSYAESGGTAPLGLGDLANGGQFDGAGRLQVNLPPGGSLLGARIDNTLYVLGAYVYNWMSLVLNQGGVVANVSNGSVVGTVSASGELLIPSRAGQTVAAFVGAAATGADTTQSVNLTVETSIDPATLTVSGNLAGGAPFSATADAFGVLASGGVTGNYSAATGALALQFAQPVLLSTLAYSAMRLAPQQAVANVWGLDQARIAADGMVPIVRQGQVAVLRHTLVIGPSVRANGATVNCGRTDLADVRVIGGDGAAIITGWTADLATGVVSIDDVTGWAQPVTIEHAIEHVALVTGVPDAATVQLGRALTRPFPAGSVLSTALLLGDLQATVGATWTQQTWTQEWSNAPIGAAISADYQEASFPIAVTNRGAMTERWALIFKTNTTFDCFGETLGLVGSGTINADFAPVNPATASPYFTLLATGWGAGWAGGNVLRFNTQGGAAAVWAARCVLPSAPGTTDRVLIGLRGDLDA